MKYSDFLFSHIMHHGRHGILPCRPGCCGPQDERPCDISENVIPFDVDRRILVDRLNPCSPIPQEKYPWLSTLYPAHLSFMPLRNGQPCIVAQGPYTVWVSRNNSKIGPFIGEGQDIISVDIPRIDIGAGDVTFKMVDAAGNVMLEFNCMLLNSDPQVKANKPVVFSGRNVNLAYGGEKVISQSCKTSILLATEPTVFVIDDVPDSSIEEGVVLHLNFSRMPVTSFYSCNRIVIRTPDAVGSVGIEVTSPDATVTTGFGGKLPVNSWFTGMISVYPDGHATIHFTIPEVDLAELTELAQLAAVQAEAAKDTATEKASEAAESATDAAESDAHIQGVVEHVDEVQETVEGYKDAAAASATAASESATEASGYASTAEGYKDSAAASMTTASNKASEASQHASLAQGYKDSALQSKTDAASSASAAASSATSASQSAASASTSMTTASNKAAEASASASSASASASSAQSYSQQASGSVSTASLKASEASVSASSASQAASSASQSAASAASSESSASSSATSAEASAERAEQAALALPDPTTAEPGQVPTVQEDHTVAYQTPSEVVTDHRELTHRDASDSHPMGAITGLQDALNEKATVHYDTAAPTEASLHDIYINTSVKRQYLCTAVSEAGAPTWTEMQYLPLVGGKIQNLTISRQATAAGYGFIWRNIDTNQLEFTFQVSSNIACQMGNGKMNFGSHTLYPTIIDGTTTTITGHNVIVNTDNNNGVQLQKVKYLQNITTEIPANAASPIALSEGVSKHTPDSAPTYKLPAVATTTTVTHEIFLSVDMANTASIAFQDSTGTIIPVKTSYIPAVGDKWTYYCVWNFDNWAVLGIKVDEASV